MTAIQLLATEDGRSVGMAWPWEKSREFNALKEQVRATLGASWDKESYTWWVPTDNYFPLERTLRTQGHTFQANPALLSWLATRDQIGEHLASIMFQLDMDWPVDPRIITEPWGPQKVAAAWLYTVNDGCLLADPTGGGKTLSCILDAMRFLPEDGPADQVLYLTLGSMRWTALGEWKRHLGPDWAAHNITVVDGTKRQRREQWAEPTMVKITGWETLLHHDWADAPHTWRRVYADEVSKAKNWKSKVSKRLASLDSQHGIVGMTASPIETHPMDIFNLMDIMRPGMLGWPRQFQKQFMVMDDEDRFLRMRPDTQGKLHDLLGPYMLRRDKKLLHPYLPPKIPQTVEIQLTSKERKEYNRIADDFVRWVSDKAREDAVDPLVGILRSRQYLNSPQLADSSYSELGSKMRTFLDLVGTVPEKMLVFSQWDKTVRFLVRYLRETQGRPVYAISGSITPRAKVKTEVIEAFNADPREAILIATDAIQQGQNIQGASFGVHYDALWNPAKMWEQREGRIWRPGQESVVTWATLVCLDTIEEVIQLVLAHRQGVANSVTDGAVASMMRRWTAQEWRKALAGQLPEGAR